MEAKRITVESWENMGNTISITKSEEAYFDRMIQDGLLTMELQMQEYEECAKIEFETNESFL